MTAATDDHFRRAFALHQEGRLREALDAYNAALSRSPAHAPALHYSGVLLLQAGQPDAALPRLERAVALDPQPADAWSNLALGYQAAGRTADALRALDQATRRAPRDPAIWENFAAALLDASQPADAERAARHALTLSPRSPGLWYNLALALHQQQRHADAEQAVTRALSLAPGTPALVGLRAAIEEAQGRQVGARQMLESALRTAPDAALAFQLGSVCERLDDLPGAADAYEHATRLGDPQGAALSQLLFVRKRLADWRDLDGLRARFRAGIEARLPLLSPFCLLSDPASRAQQRQCAETWAMRFGSSSGTDTAQGVGTARLADDPARERLTIGYLSADFHMHATALLTAGLFEHHDRKRYHVIAYSTGPDDQSPLRKRLAAAFDRMVDAQGWSAQILAARIRQDGVDVLVDLKGHTENARMDVLALRPAPVQVSYLGYPGTTGAAFIDYVLGDATVTPVEHAGEYSETLVQLPGCYQVNDASRVIAGPRSRAELGLPAGAPVLCCFNQIYKINPQVLDAWTAVLRACPTAVLWLLARSDDDPAIAHLRAETLARGIAPERLVFATRRPNPEYLALYEHADLCLDTWPYNGHTTTADALWAGCPVVTLLGDTFAGRVAASIVQTVGLPELIAASVEDYVRIAAALVQDAQRSQALRRYLETEGRRSRLFDVARTTRAVERAYEAIVAQARAGRRAPIVIGED